jgi:GH24 family phage-related lysozyme (muramidase)
MTSAAALNEGIKLIKEFEGLELKAYPDPGTGGDPWTIGWGNTRYLDGSPVKKGQTITAPQADTLLLDMLHRDVVPALEAIPFWQEMSEKQQGALISFGWNLGWRFYGANGFATISARLKNKEWTKIPEALLLYRNPGTSVEAGLRRRREAEGKLWKEGMVKPSAPKPEQSLSMINVAKFYKGEPHQDSALHWLDKSLTAMNSVLSLQSAGGKPLQPSLRIPCKRPISARGTMPQAKAIESVLAALAQCWRPSMAK